MAVRRDSDFIFLLLDEAQNGAAVRGASPRVSEQFVDADSALWGFEENAQNGAAVRGASPRVSEQFVNADSALCALLRWYILVNIIGYIPL